VTIQRRIEETIARALGIPAPDSTTPLKMGSTPSWDSMGHMTVVIALEKEFGVRFSVHQLPELIDVASIEKTLSRFKDNL
jgi:acyl carrier protein